MISTLEHNFLKNPTLAKNTPAHNMKLMDQCHPCLEATCNRILIGTSPKFQRLKSIWRPRLVFILDYS